MNKRQPDIRGYMAAGLLGAAVGALAVLLGTRAVPRMMGRMMTMCPCQKMMRGMATPTAASSAGGGT